MVTQVDSVTLFFKTTHTFGSHAFISSSKGHILRFCYYCDALLAKEERRRRRINKMAPPGPTPLTETLKPKENCQKQLYQNLGKESKFYSTQTSTESIKSTLKWWKIFVVFLLIFVPCPHGHGITLLEGNQYSHCGTDSSSGRARKPLVTIYHVCPL